MSDLISRAAAIEALGERPLVWTDDDQYTLGERNQYDIDRLAIGTLPSAEVTLCHLGSPCEYQNADIAMPTIDPVKWIPVSERLPIPNSVYEDEPVYYLVQNEYGDMMVATFVKYPGGARVWQQMYQYGAIMEDIVAWMPLPEPWKGEENGCNTGI